MILLNLSVVFQKRRSFKLIAGVDWNVSEFDVTVGETTAVVETTN